VKSAIFASDHAFSALTSGEAEPLETACLRAPADALRMSIPVISEAPVRVMKPARRESIPRAVKSPRRLQDCCYSCQDDDLDERCQLPSDHFQQQEQKIAKKQ